MKLARAGICYVIAAVLLYSGFLHITHQYLFLDAVLRYQVLPWPLAVAAALAFPCAHVIAGIQLVFPKTRCLGLPTAFVLLFTYGVAQWSVVARGMTISCGCFGVESGTVSWTSALSVSATSGAVLLTWLTESRRDDHRVK